MFLLLVFLVCFFVLLLFWGGGVGGILLLLLFCLFLTFHVFGFCVGALAVILVSGFFLPCVCILFLSKEEA